MVTNSLHVVNVCNLIWAIIVASYSNYSLTKKQNGAILLAGMCKNSSCRKLIDLLVADSGSLNKAAKALGFTRQYLALIRDGLRSISEEVRRAVYCTYSHNKAVISLIRRLHDESLYTGT